MRRIRNVVAAAILLSLTACGLMVVTARNTEQLQLGMTMEEVRAVLGSPASMAADKDAQTMYYRLRERDAIGAGERTTTFFVRFVAGRLESFGRVNEPEPVIVVPSRE